MLAAKLIFTALLLGSLVLGTWMFRNFDRLVGVDPLMPSETEGARFINKGQFIVIWALTVKLLGMMAWIL